MKKLLPLLFLLHSLIPFAQWNNDPAINTPVCTVQATHQFFPQMVPDENGGAIIAWMETTDLSTGQIRAQHLSAQGQLLWPAAGVVVCPITQIQSSHRIVSDGNGGAIISWMEQRDGDGTIPKHYVQKITASGQLQWDINGISVCPTASPYNYSYQLISDGKSGAILVWDDNRVPAIQIFSQRISPDGMLLWPAQGLASSPQQVQGNLFNAIADTTGGVILCWPKATGIATLTDLFVQRITGDGILQWGANGLAICSAAKDQFLNKLISDGKGGAFVLWQDFRKDPILSQFYGQRVGADGSIYWEADGRLLVDSMAASSTVFKLVSDSAGGGIFTWLADFDYFTQDTVAYLYAQRFDSMGTTQWPEHIMATWQDTQIPAEYQLSTDSKQGSFVSWLKASNIHPFGDELLDIYNVYAQHLLPNGETQWPDSGILVSSAPQNQVSLTMVCDSNGVAILSWMDSRSTTNYDIYAARLQANIALPVGWVSFSAGKEGAFHVLSWTTANESENKGFHIERSGDGFQFDSIGFVAGTGSSSQLQDYFFTDRSPLKGRNHYRLKQIDIDGKFEYSKIVWLDNFEIPEVSVYPNPASKKLGVNIKNGNARIYIYGSNGTLVKTRYSTSPGMNEIDISELPAGLYYIKIQSGSAMNNWTGKFFKL